jgi:iron(III) transport system substrate-binding protein
MASNLPRRKTIWRIAALVGLSLILGVSSTGLRTSKAQSTPTDDYQQMIEDSKAESDGLLIYSSLSDQTLRPLVTAFKEKYPWIAVTNAETTNFDVFNAYYDEIDQGVRTADLLISSDLEQWEELNDEGEYAEYFSTEDANLPDFAKDDKHLYLLASNPMLLIWNKDAVKEPLTTLKDLAALIAQDPAAYQGQIQTLDASRSVTSFEVNWFYLQTKGDAGWAVLNQIGKAKPVGAITSANIVEDVRSGKAKAAFFVEASAVAPYLNDDPKLGWSPIVDGMPVAEYLMGATQNATSPNSARLFIDFALSQEGQLALAKGGLPAYREDVRDTAKIHEDQFFENVTEENQIFFDGDKVSTDDNAEEAFITKWKAALQLE